MVRWELVGGICGGFGLAVIGEIRWQIRGGNFMFSANSFGFFRWDRWDRILSLFFCHCEYPMVCTDEWGNEGWREREREKEKMSGEVMSFDTATMARNVGADSTTFQSTVTTKRGHSDLTFASTAGSNKDKGTRAL